MKGKIDRDKEGTLEDGAMPAVTEGQAAARGGGETAGGGEGHGEAVGEMGSRRREQHLFWDAARERREMMNKGDDADAEY